MSGVTANGAASSNTVQGSEKSAACRVIAVANSRLGSSMGRVSASCSSTVDVGVVPVTSGLVSAGTAETAAGSDASVATGAAVSVDAEPTAAGVSESTDEQAASAIAPTTIMTKEAKRCRW